MSVTVEIDGIKYVPDLETDAPPATNVDCDGNELNVGDFAYVRLSALGSYEGMDMTRETRYGKVLKVQGGYIGLEFPTKSDFRHGMSGLTQIGHGYFFNQKEIRRLS